jgi:hypothetical protein
MTETPQVDDFELPDVDAMEEYVTRLQAGAVILYSLLNEIHTLHTPNDNDECPQCKEKSPCRTASVMLETMVEVEETPAE